MFVVHAVYLGYWSLVALVLFDLVRNAFKKLALELECFCFLLCLLPLLYRPYQRASLTESLELFAVVNELHGTSSLTLLLDGHVEVPQGVYQLMSSVL